jgi:hypothetical protein
VRPRRLALAAFAAMAVAANAAELPSRQPKPKPDEKLRRCEIGGERGIALPGGGCVKISGDIDVGVATGNLRH